MMQLDKSMKYLSEEQVLQLEKVSDMNLGNRK